MASVEEPAKEGRVGQRVRSARGEVTPGERLMYALGQLHKQWLVRATLTLPDEVDVEAVARMLGVWGDVEFVQDGEGEGDGEQCIHFPCEVLLIDRRREFPRTLLDVWEWARGQETREFWRYLD
jgi:hypothetical protein